MAFRGITPNCTQTVAEFVRKLLQNTDTRFSWRTRLSRPGRPRHAIVHCPSDQKVPSKIVVFPDEGHWVLKPQNSMFWYRNFLDWVGEWTAKRTSSK